VAVTTTRPVAAAVTRPPEETVAIESLEERQVDWLVTSCEPEAVLAFARSCVVPPTVGTKRLPVTETYRTGGGVGVDGEGDDGEGEEEPPQAPTQSMMAPRTASPWKEATAGVARLPLWLA